MFTILLEMAKEVLSARVLGSVAAAAKSRAENDEVSLSEVVEQALREYLGLVVEAPGLSDRLSAVEYRLSQVEKVVRSGNGYKGRGKASAE